MELEHAIGFCGRTANGLHVHPDGEILVYAQGGCVLIASLKDAHAQTFLRGHENMVTCLDMSASGALIASGECGDNSDVVVWDYETRVEKFRLQEHDLGVHRVHFSSDERFLLTVGLDKKMLVWDMLNGMIVAKSGKLRQVPSCAAWGGRARDVKNRETTSYQFATGGEAQLTSWVLDPAAGTLVPEECSMGNQVRNFTALAYSADEAYLFAGSSSSDLTAVHVKHKVMHSTTTCGSAGVLTIVATRAADGDRLLVGCGDGTIAVLEGLRNGAQMCRSYVRGPEKACAVRLDGGVRALVLHAVNEESGELRVLAGTEQGTLYAASLCAADQRSLSAPAAQAHLIHESHADKVIAVAYPKGDSEQFATASTDGTVRVWDVNDYSVAAKGVCQVKLTGEPLCMDFIGHVIFSGWQDGRIRAHDAESGEQLWTIDECHKQGVTALCVSSNRKFIVSGGAMGEVRVWEIRTREMIVNLKQHTMAVTALCLYDDDSHVFSASRDRTIYLWDLRAESRVKGLEQKMGGLNGLAVLPNHIELISIGQEKCVSLWDARESAPLQQVPTHIEQTCVATFTPKGPTYDSRQTVFATGSTDSKIRLWGYNPLRLLATGDGHSAPVRSVKFSPDGKQLVSVGDDAGVLIWNIFLDDAADGAEQQQEQQQQQYAMGNAPAQSGYY